MKHSNGLKWHFKRGLALECLIIEISYKSHGMKIEKVFLYRKYALFAGDKKLVKT